MQQESRLENGIDRLITVVDPTSPTAEAYRALRTNLLYAVVDNPPKVIMLTSPGPGEGKSTTCANLGVVLAHADKSTLVVDCDFRKPVIHRFFGLRNIYGITNVLLGERSLEEVWNEPIEGLKVVSVGPPPINPAEILGSRRFADFLANARERFAYVLIDASPIGLVTDPAVVATQADGVFLVIDAQSTRKGAVRRAVHSLTAVNAHLIGTVLNNVEPSKGDYYYYHSYKYPY